MTAGPAHATKTRWAALGGRVTALRHDTASALASSCVKVSAESLFSNVARHERNCASPIALASAAVAGRTEASATLPKISTGLSNHETLQRVRGGLMSDDPADASGLIPRGLRYAL